VPVTTKERIAASAAADSPLAYRFRQPAPKTRASASRARPLWRGSRGPPSRTWTVLRLSWVLAARWTACRKLREHPRRAISRVRVGTNSTICDRISLGSPSIRRALRAPRLFEWLVGCRGCVTRFTRQMRARIDARSVSFSTNWLGTGVFDGGAVSEKPVLLCSSCSCAGAYRQRQRLLGNATGCALIARLPALSRTHIKKCHPSHHCSASLHTRCRAPSRTGHAWLRGTRGRRRRMGQLA
jgi:hypothetical protein